jgi:hypothetical protein
MGNSLTIDNTPSQLEEIIEADPKVVQATKLKHEVPDSINLHLKAWKLSTSEDNPYSAKTEGIPLKQVHQEGIRAELTRPDILRRRCSHSAVSVPRHQPWYVCLLLFRREQRRFHHQEPS